MIGKPPTKDLTYEWQSLTKAVGAAFDQGEFAKAEDLSWESLAKSKVMGEFEPRLAISLSNLAVVQRQRGQYDRAEDLSNIALRILQALESKGELMCKALMNAACFFHEEGRLGEARRLFSKAIALAETGSLDSLLCQSLCLFARLCSDQSKYSQAEILLNRVSSLDSDDPECRILYLLTYTQCSIRQDKLHRAEQLLSDAEELLHERVQKQLLWKSSVLSLKGELRAAQYQASQLVSGATDMDLAGKRRSVIEAYEHSLDIREQVLGPYHCSCGELLRKKAEFYFQLSEYHDCEELLRRALSISLSAKGPYNLETFRCLDLSGQVLRATSQHQDAEEMEERCRQVEKRVREMSRETYVVWGEPDED
jgi:eukaryotic-like serine/threonine-protein kinase